MANLKDIKSKNVKITLLDGVERTIRYDLNAMAELEDKYGSVDAAFETLNTNSVKALRYILWVGLMHEDENLTEQKVGSLIDITSMAAIMSTLGEAFDADMPTAENVPAVDTNTDPNA